MPTSADSRINIASASDYYGYTRHFGVGTPLAFVDRAGRAGIAGRGGAGGAGLSAGLGEDGTGAQGLSLSGRTSGSNRRSPPRDAADRWTACGLPPTPAVPKSWSRPRGRSRRGWHNNWRPGPKPKGIWTPPGLKTRPCKRGPSRCERSTPRQIETALGDLLTDRLTELSAPRDAVRTYRLTSDGSSVDLSIDPASAQVKIFGPGPLVDAAAKVVQVLDSPVENGRSVQLMAVAHGAPGRHSAGHRPPSRLCPTAAPSIPTRLAFYQAKPADDTAAAAPANPAAVGPGGQVRADAGALGKAAQPAD